MSTIQSKITSIKKKVNRKGLEMTMKTRNIDLNEEKCKIWRKNQIELLKLKYIYIYLKSEIKNLTGWA